MHTTNSVARLDATVADYLAYFRSLGRSYKQEECVLRSMLEFLSAKRVVDLDRQIFDLWRNTPIDDERVCGIARQLHALASVPSKPQQDFPAPMLPA